MSVVFNIVTNSIRSSYEFYQYKNGSFNKQIINGNYNKLNPIQYNCSFSMENVKENDSIFINENFNKINYIYINDLPIRLQLVSNVTNNY